MWIVDFSIVENTLVSFCYCPEICATKDGLKHGVLTQNMIHFWVLKHQSALGE
jgi:hypothetical protein